MADPNECMRLFGEIQTSQKDFKEDVVEVKQNVKEILGKLVGNGVPGLCTRLDRLEQSHGRNIWWLRSVAATALTALCGLIVSHFTGKH